MVIRTGKALAQERAWREASRQRQQARAPAVPVASRDDVGFWLGVCIVLAFVAALLLR